MKRLSILPLLAAAACGAPSTSEPARPPQAADTPLAAAVATGDLEAFRASARAEGVAFDIPRFEETPEEVAARVDLVLVSADDALAVIAAQDPQRVTFAGAFAALDDVLYPVYTVFNRMLLMRESHPDPAMRAACGEAVQRLEAWKVGVGYREDLYRVCAGFAERYRAGQAGVLEGEDLKLFEDTLRNYRRAGFALDAETRAQVAELLVHAQELATAFDANITGAAADVYFTPEELEGVPVSFLQASRTQDGRHKVRAHVTPDYVAVMENATRRDVREALFRARYTLAKETNGPVLAELVATRDRIATLLGYANWADYRIEPKMAGDGATALAFVEGLIDGLEPKFQAEVEVLTDILRDALGDEEATLEWWDFRWAQNQLMKREYGVDSEALRVYFPLDRVLDGMFAAYQRIFGLEFRRVEPPQKWVDDLRLYTVSDAATGAPLGAFYLDLFPRPGKYNHFAQFDVVGGKRRGDGRYQRPVAALVCNFTPGVGDEPALMTHDEVETVFHEFGHAMHAILTQARYAQFAGTMVPRDFVEAPSQMFEAWAWDPAVLATFAADWRDPSRRLPVEQVEAMEAAQLATVGVYYRRQMGLALSDLRLHMGGAPDPQEVINAANSEALFRLPEDTHFGAYWGHLTGYDAGYYGYGWADVLAADMATVFEQAPGRYFDVDAGMRLRHQIYEVGGSRPASESVRAFLGREPRDEAFLRSLGITQ